MMIARVCTSSDIADDIVLVANHIATVCVLSGS